MLSQLELIFALEYDNIRPCYKISDVMTLMNKHDVLGLIDFIHGQIGSVLVSINTFTIKHFLSDFGVHNPNIHDASFFNTCHLDLSQSVYILKYSLDFFESFLDKDAISISEERKLIRLKKRIES